MTVTQVEALFGSKSKYRVYLDGQPAFVLYRGELSRYHIREGWELAEKDYGDIREMLTKRARLRAMKLLEISDRSEEALRRKLSEGGYPPGIVENAVAYVKSFGYLDDSRLAEHIVYSRKGQKSRAELQACLLRKGLSREQAEKALEKAYTSDDAKEAIRRLAEKKHFDPGCATPAEKQKLCAYFLRKGYRYEDIRQVIQVSDRNA